MRHRTPARTGEVEEEQEDDGDGGGGWGWKWGGSGGGDDQDRGDHGQHPGTPGGLEARHLSSSWVCPTRAQ